VIGMDERMCAFRAKDRLIHLLSWSVVSVACLDLV
jgi:hypothetical protein